MSEDLLELLPRIITTDLVGSLVHTDGQAMAVAGCPAPVGALVEIERQAGPPLRGEVVGFRNEHAIVHPLGQVTGVRRGSQVRLVNTARYVRVGEALLGRVIGAEGNVLDRGPRPGCLARTRLDRQAPEPVERPRIQQPLGTGIRAIDAMLTCGRGQRIGIFSGSGVGKSVTLGMMARYTAADVNVIGLVGERGREVNEFLERDLGPEGLARSVVVVATSDQPALMRVQAAFTATAVAEYFRDRGNHVQLMMDSLTRVALAQREIGLAAGETPTTRGYPPSVFGMLPRLAERAGLTAKGSITGFYNVLVEGDDTNEPISDTVRGLLDGHVMLSRELAAQGHYPAIDVLSSISRLMPAVTSTQHQHAVQTIRRLLAVHQDHQDLISIGAYRPGSNPLVDTAIHIKPKIDQFLCQGMDESTAIEVTVKNFIALAERCQQSKPAVQNTADS
ncbi:MAG: FliI/YscN family ATPase [Planctomycetota bacterium]